MGNGQLKAHPASILRDLRSHVFVTYEKHCIDEALSILKRSSLPRTITTGVHAELVFYDKYRDEFALEPLLDAGSKADFIGRRPRNGLMTNFDVTTNLSYKDIDHYVNCVKTRGKKYEIALVNLRSKEVEFFPLRFPICKRCNTFSHYVLYLLPPSTTLYQAAGTSDEQTIIRYCPRCADGTEILSYSYEIPSIANLENEMRAEQDVDDSLRYSDREVKEAVQSEATSIIRFFRRLSCLELSGVAENHERLIGSDGDEFVYEGKLYWKHPLAKSLDDAVDFYYGPWLS